MKSEVVDMQCRLGEILKERGIKKIWLADKVGVNRASIKNLIKGTEPHLTLARKIAKALNVSIDDIWPEDDNP